MMLTTASKAGFLRYEDTELDEESWRIAKQEVKENEDNKRKCLDILKKKLLGKCFFFQCLVLIRIFVLILKVNI